MKNKQPKQAFTLIELLTVIAIIGILASILIPTVGRVRESARRSVDASNIRQIGQASLIYANDNREALPPRNLNANGVPQGTGDTTTLKRFAAALALGGGLNDSNIWISASDSAAAGAVTGPIMNPQIGTAQRTMRTEFSGNQVPALSFGAVAGLRTSTPSTAPIAFTRGLGTDGRWETSRTNSVYGPDGGHIVFMGGNVSFYRNLKGDDDNGALVRSDGERTDNILQTITQNQGLFLSFGGNNPLDQQLSTGQ